MCLTQGAGGGVCVCVLTGLGFNPHRDCVCTNVDPSEKTACDFFFFCFEGQFSVVTNVAKTLQKHDESVSSLQTLQIL